MKTCPFCAEEIQEAAVVCKHCGRDLDTGDVPETYTSLVAKEQVLDTAVTEYLNAGWVTVWRTLKGAQLNFPKKINWGLLIFLIVISVFIFEILPLIYLIWFALKKPESIDLTVTEDGQILLDGGPYRIPAKPTTPKKNVVKAKPNVRTPEEIEANNKRLVTVALIIIGSIIFFVMICAISGALG